MKYYGTIMVNFFSFDLFIISEQPCSKFFQVRSNNFKSFIFVFFCSLKKKFFHFSEQSILFIHRFFLYNTLFHRIFQVFLKICSFKKNDAHLNNKQTYWSVKSRYSLKSCQVCSVGVDNNQYKAPPTGNKNSA